MERSEHGGAEQEEAGGQGDGGDGRAGRLRRRGSDCGMGRCELGGVGEEVWVGSIFLMVSVALD